MTSFTGRRDGMRRGGGAMAWGGAALVSALAWPARVYRTRRLMLDLARLSDHDLRDIGLTRLDLHDANALPRAADPSLALRRRVEERRRRR